MALRTDSFDLTPLRLSSGEGRRLDLNIGFDPLELGGEEYAVQPDLVPARLYVSRTTGEGYALRLRFEAGVSGRCMRCLEPAAPSLEVDSREIWQPGGVEEFETPYLDAGVLDVRGWARDAVVLMLPAQILCRPDCAGLCPICGAALNESGPAHTHEAEPDPRWAKLSELRFD